MLIADSWFGSMACVQALFAKKIFAVMNVKTAHRGFPKRQLLDVVGEVKGKSADAKAHRRARRGKSIAYTKRVQVNGEEVTILAAGNNKKVPLLLVATHSTMNPGDKHVKKWTVPCADGSIETHQLVTDQPQVHQLYREHMNVVDIHNKLRQGVCAVADVWRTTQWPERHFGELLGILEVNIFKTLTYFVPAFKTMSHPDFRRQLAWELMTLGKAVCPMNETLEKETTNAHVSATTCEHEYLRFDGNARHRCAYCGQGAYYYCLTCHKRGLGCMAMCGMKTGRDCISRHAAGEKAKHASWTFSRKRKDLSSSDGAGPSSSEDVQADVSLPSQPSASLSSRPATSRQRSRPSRPTPLVYSS